MSIDAVFENGVLRPLSPLPLGEKQPVRIMVASVQAPPGELRSFYAAAGGLIGSIDCGIEDLGSDERHLEGFARRSNRP